MRANVWTFLGVRPYVSKRQEQSAPAEIIGSESGVRVHEESLGVPFQVL